MAGIDGLAPSSDQRSMWWDLGMAASMAVTSEPIEMATAVAKDESSSIKSFGKMAMTDGQQVLSRHSNARPQ